MANRNAEYMAMAQPSNVLVFFVSVNADAFDMGDRLTLCVFAHPRALPKTVKD